MRLIPLIAVIIFTFVAIVQATRYFYGWEVTVNGTVIPLWVSLVGTLVPGLMAILLWQDAQKKKSR